MIHTVIIVDFDKQLASSSVNQVLKPGGVCEYHRVIMVNSACVRL